MISTSSETVPKTELEQLALDSIRLRAILYGMNQQNRAMIQSSAGKTYFITEKMKLGPRNGIVRKITPDAILVREKFTNIAGKQETVDSEIKLANEASGSRSGSGSGSELGSGLGSSFSERELGDRRSGNENRDVGCPWIHVREEDEMKKKWLGILSLCFF